MPYRFAGGLHKLSYQFSSSQNKVRSMVNYMSYIDSLINKSTMAGHPSPGHLQNEGSEVFTVPCGLASVEALASANGMSARRPAIRSRYSAARFSLNPQSGLNCRALLKHHFSLVVLFIKQWIAASVRLCSNPTSWTLLWVSRENSRLLLKIK